MKFLPCILLVEDNHTTASILKEALRNEYVLDTVDTGKGALYRTDSEQYDLIILDLTLPDVHGAAVCQELRERGVKTPILVLSADDSPRSKMRLLDVGANDYLTKPFSL